MVVTVVIILIIAFMLFVSIKETVKHFKGQSSCCGGGSQQVNIKAKKIKSPQSIKYLSIEGMKCKNCSQKIQNHLNSLDGVEAKVSLKKKTATIKLLHDIDDQVLIDAVVSSGYSAKVIN